MTGLPQGVTLEPYWPERAEAQTLRVMVRGQVVGSVWSTYMYGFAASTTTGQARKGFPTEDAAVRWVCLQARPVVYQVRREPLGYRSATTGMSAPWLVYGPGQRYADWWAANAPSAIARADRMAREHLERSR